MKLLYRCCAGLDIHRDTVSACIRRRVRGQAEASIEEEVFGTFTWYLRRFYEPRRRLGRSWWWRLLSTNSGMTT
jgi:hypothetical protein